MSQVVNPINRVTIQDLPTEMVELSEEALSKVFGGREAVFGPPEGGAVFGPTGGGAVFGPPERAVFGPTGGRAVFGPPERAVFGPTGGRAVFGPV